MAHQTNGRNYKRELRTNNMNPRYAVVLAAGQGTRMKSSLYKVLHPVAGKPMVGHVVEEAKKAHTTKVVTITGTGAEKVQEYLGNQTEYALQEEQLGTAHAVLQARSLLEGKEGSTMVLCGDTPLLTGATLEAIFSQHEKEAVRATVLTAIVEDPTGYGRVIRDNTGQVIKIVEEKDASAEEKKVKEINTGTYCFDNAILFECLDQVDNNNAQGEYYLPDVIEALRRSGERVSAFALENEEDALGVNDRIALAEAERIMRARINRYHMQNGVSIIDPAATYIEADVKIGKDTIIEPGVVLKGQTVIGNECFIGAHSVISNSELKDSIKVLSSTITDSIVGNHSHVGPNSHLRPHSELKSHVHVGNFVEIKNAIIGEETKVGHLTYIGDATLGKDINVGCGTIFVNYDGKDKHQATVGDHSFIGCNSNLIAPVVVGAHSYIAAGSTITEHVPAGSLAIARSRQVNKEGYAKRLPSEWEN